MSRLAIEVHKTPRPRLAHAKVCHVLTVDRCGSVYFTRQDKELSLMKTQLDLQTLDRRGSLVLSSHVDAAMCTLARLSENIERPINI